MNPFFLGKETPSMSVRPEIRPQLVITNNPMTASFDGSATIIQKISVVGYTFIWTAGSTPVGTVGVQISNDFSLTPTGQISNPGTWSTYTFVIGTTAGTTAAVSGNSGSTYIEIPASGFYAIRPIFIFSSGSGTLNAWINGKVA